MKPVVNHVMSQDIASGIFTDILAYFQQFGSDQATHVVSTAPVPDAQVYHYHRPQLEKQFLPNSVCTVHHDLGETDTWLTLPRFMPRYKESAAVICLNTLQRQRLIEEGLPPSKLHVVAHGYNDRILTAKAPRRFDAEKKLTLGLVSRRYGRRVKGEAYLYELAKRLPPSRVQFLLVGQDRMIDAQVFRSLGYDVRCYERLPYRCFNDLYQEMDFLLMTSQFEGGPANIPEAVATGTPVLANPIGMAYDYVQNGVNGLHLTMDVNVDARTVLGLLRNQAGVTDRLYQGASKRTQSALTWKQSIEGNVAVHLSVAKDASLFLP